MTDIADLIEARFGLATDAGRGDAAAGTIGQILGRRSYRKYTDQDIGEDRRTILLAAAQSASAKSDLQQYSIIDVRDQAVKTRIAELCATDWMGVAPILLVFCGDIRRAQRICEMRGKPYAQNTLDSFMNAAVDAALALQSYSIAAEASGLGCCPISQVRNNMKEMTELLKLPKGVYPVAGLTAGIPAETRDVTLRLPPAAVVHRDCYVDENLEAEIDTYDRSRHAIRPTPPAGQLKTDEYGTADFYGWSENAARRLSAAEGRAGFRKFLETHGFDLE
ncbi:MAG: nitroreductase family protein [Rhodospirillales bacterium]|nr:nitroreductase family protein [Rhodospirillales bacterium]